MVKIKRTENNIDPYTLIEYNMNKRLLEALENIKDKDNKKEILIQIGKEIAKIEYSYHTNKPKFPDIMNFYYGLEYDISRFLDDYCSYIATKGTIDELLNNYTKIIKIDDYLTRVKQDIIHLKNECKNFNNYKNPLSLGFRVILIENYKEDIKPWLEVWAPSEYKLLARRMGVLIGKKEEEKKRLAGIWYVADLKYKRSTTWFM